MKEISSEVGLADLESDANSQLVDMAPELLEALKKLLDYAVFMGCSPHYERVVREAIDELERRS